MISVNFDHSFASISIAYICVSKHPSVDIFYIVLCSSAFFTSSHDVYLSITLHTRTTFNKTDTGLQCDQNCGRICRAVLLLPSCHSVLSLPSFHVVLALACVTIFCRTCKWTCRKYIAAWALLRWTQLFKTCRFIRYLRNYKGRSMLMRVQCTIFAIPESML